jgi:hypothetical protein
MKEIIFIAKPDNIAKEYPEYLEFHKHFTETVGRYHFIEELNISDLWVRDFLPFQNRNSKELKLPFYYPPYIKNKTISARIRNETIRCFPQAKNCLSE